MNMAAIESTRKPIDSTCRKQVIAHQHDGMKNLLNRDQRIRFDKHRYIADWLLAVHQPCLGINNIVKRP